MVLYKAKSLFNADHVDSYPSTYISVFTLASGIGRDAHLSVTVVSVPVENSLQTSVCDTEGE